MSSNTFVFNVESPSDNDFLHGITEGKALSEMLSVTGISSSYFIATSLEAFKTAINEKLPQEAKNHGKFPLLHLSMHGSSQGVGFTNGDELSWDQLRNLLLPIIRAMNGSLVICMSSCFGGSGCRMAMYTDNEPTFYALIGIDKKIDVFDTALSYASFYNLIFKGHPFDSALAGMRAATCNREFILHFGQETRQEYIEFLNQQSVNRLLKSLGVGS